MLHANGPDRELGGPKLALYGWLVGRWEMDVTTTLDDGTTHRGRGEIHAGWVLQGRQGIQDVRMIPRLEERKPGIAPLPGAGNWYGTTLRLYDPNLDAWRILWNDPVTNFFTQQIGRARGRQTSSRPDRIPGAGRCAGRSQTSKRTRSIGRASARRTTATGGAKWIYAPVVPKRQGPGRPSRSGAFK